MNAARPVHRLDLFNVPERRRRKNGKFPPKKKEVLAAGSTVCVVYIISELRNILECAGLNSVKSPTLSLYPTYMQRRESLSLSACFLRLFSSFYFLQLPGNVTIQKRHAIKEKLVGRGRTAGMCIPPPSFLFLIRCLGFFFLNSSLLCSCSGCCSLLPSCVLFRWGYIIRFRSCGCAAVVTVSLHASPAPRQPQLPVSPIP